MGAILPVWNDDVKSAELSEQIKPLLAKVENPSEKMASLQSQADVLAQKTVWIIGGDGWTYDIGYGSLDQETSKRNKARNFEK